MLKLHYYKYSLELQHPFTIAGNSRTFTPVVFVELHYKDWIGYGEASLPPYLKENQESVFQFLAQLNIEKFEDPLLVDEILNYIESIAPENSAAKAAVDIALHDLIGKILNKPLYEILNIDISKMPETSMTIGIDKIEKIIEKVKEAKNFKILKVKLGCEYDQKIIKKILEISDQKISIDANQGWPDKEKALEMIEWLAERKIVFVEQPMPKLNFEDACWLKERSPLPIMADESVQRFLDVEKIASAFHGINIKLMKCSGIREARQMIEKARALNLKILIGCMNESSCANLAAAQLAPLADWVDLDGPFMITNNPFEDPLLSEGKIILPCLPGIGLVKKAPSANY